MRPLLSKSPCNAPDGVDVWMTGVSGCVKITMTVAVVIPPEPSAMV